MPAGRKPTPTNLKILHGNPGKRPLPVNEPKPAPLAPKCPRWLNKEAKKEWRRIAPQLERLGLLTELDMANLAGYCHSYAQMIEAQAYLAKHGLSYKIPQRDRDGHVVGIYAQQWPEVSIVRQCKAEIVRYSSHFGMSPSERGRMSVPGAEDKRDGMAALFDEVNRDAIRPGKG